MRDCPNVEMRDRLPELLHGRLTAAAAEELSAHLSACATCREELELLRSLRGALAVPADVDVDAITAALPRRPARRVGGRWRRWGSVAAVALAAGIAAVMILDRSRERAPSSDAPDGQAPPSRIVAETAVRSVPAPTRAPHPAAPERELALGAGLADVDDRELARLISDVERLEAVPVAEPEEYLPVAPTGSGGDTW